jgi:hypothetical protein
MTDPEVVPRDGPQYFGQEIPGYESPAIAEFVPRKRSFLAPTVIAVLIVAGTLVVINGLGSDTTVHAADRPVPSAPHTTRPYTTPSSTPPGSTAPQSAAPRPTSPSLTDPPVAAPPQAPARVAAPPPCDWMATYNKAKAGQPGTWSIANPASSEWAGDAQQTTGAVRIRPSIPCESLPFVVMHEAQHVKQGRIYDVTNKDPRVAYAARNAETAILAPYGGVEINADCAARYLLGPRLDLWVGGYTPARQCTGAQLRGGIATANGQRVSY